MSFESMIDDEPPATALRQRVINATDGFGAPKHELVTELTGIPGRVVLLSGRSQEAWAAVGIVADHDFLTQEVRIEQGMFLEVDDRRFRVMGRGKRMGKGSIDRYYKIPLQEVFNK
jgi:hypothetical protein